MPLDLTALDGVPRLLLEAELKPIQGTRFQPTGFPNLGAAKYSAPQREPDEQDKPEQKTWAENVLVESAQSMANRLEAACWDAGADTWVADLQGLPFVRVMDGAGAKLTTSVQEAHRLNSPYIENTGWFATLKSEVGYDEKARRPIDFRGRVYPAILKYDPNALVHGFFLESIAGLIRSPRVLSAFIEAEDVRVASSGGVKNDRVDASGKSEGGGAKEGYGNVPFSRDEYVAERIVGYFNVDLAQIRGFGLSADAGRLVLGLTLYKIRALLDEGLRLRTACDLDVVDVKVTRPSGFVLPSTFELGAEMKRLIAAVKAAGGFAEPSETSVTWTPAAKPSKG